MSAPTTHWYLLSSDGEISVRISDGMRLGESDLGELELVPLPEEVRLTLHTYAEGVQVVAAAGFALEATAQPLSPDDLDPDEAADAEDEEIGSAVGSVLLGHGDRIDFLSSTAVVSSDFSSSYRSLGTVMREGSRYAVIAQESAGASEAAPVQVDDATSDPEAPTDPSPEGSADNVADEVDSADPMLPTHEDRSSGDAPDGADEADGDADASADADDEESGTVIERAFGQRSGLAVGAKHEAKHEDAARDEAHPDFAQQRAANDSAVVDAIVPDADVESHREHQKAGAGRFGAILAVGLVLLVGVLVVLSGMLGSDAPVQTEEADVADTTQPATDAEPEAVVRGRGAAITESLTPAPEPAGDLRDHSVVEVLTPASNPRDAQSGSEPAEAAADPTAVVTPNATPSTDLSRTEDARATTVLPPEAERIAELLADADRFFDETIWTRGVEGSTAQRLIEVLQLDPDNAEARAGLERLSRGIANMRDPSSRRSSQRRLAAMLEAASIDLDGRESSALPTSTDAEIDSAEPDAIAPVTRDDAAVGDPTSAEVSRLLSSAEDQFDLGFLTEPAADSSLAYARRALELDPGNESATALIDRIADRLFVIASELAAYGQTQQARDLVAEVLAFSPEHARARELALELESRGG